MDTSPAVNIYGKLRTLINPRALAARQRYARWNAHEHTSISRETIIEPTAELRFGPVAAGRMSIGRGSHLDSGVLLSTFGGAIALGERVYIGPYCVLYGHGGITIGDNVLIASHTSIIAMNHVFAERTTAIRDQGFTAKGIAIGSDVWIGSGVRILDGVEIGEGCVIGAGAVVNKSIPPFSVAVGIPARVVRAR